MPLTGELQAAALALVTPSFIGELTVDQLTGADGSLAAWAELLLVTHPLRPAAETGSSLTLLAGTLRRVEFPDTTLEEMQGVFEPGELAEALGAFLVARVPPALLTGLRSRVQAQRALTLGRAEAAMVDTANINLVLPHLDTLHAAVSACLPGAEALRLSALLVHAASGANAVTLESLVVADRRLADFLPMLTAQAEMLPGERVAGVVDAHTQAEEAKAAAPRGDGGGAGGDAFALGYARAFLPGLRARVQSAGFISLSAALLASLDAKKHPFDSMLLIFKSLEIVYVHALLGKLKYLQGVPLVARIVEELSPFGPAFLGFLADEAVCPPGANRRLRPSPLKLEAEWGQLCSGSVKFNLEDVMWRARANGGSATLREVPIEKVYTIMSHLRHVERFGRSFFAGLGFPDGVRGSFGDGTAQLIAHLEDSEGQTGREEFAQDYMWTMLGEGSASFKHAILGKCPLVALRGVMLKEGSLATEMLTKSSAQSAEAVVQLNALRLNGYVLPQRVLVPEGLLPAEAGGSSTPKGVRPVDGGLGGAPPGPPPTGAQGGDGGVKVGAKADLVSRGPDGKGLAIGRENPDRINVSKWQSEGFRKEAGVPKGACDATWCSRSKHPWGACDKAGKPGHGAHDSPAHKVPPGWNKKWLPVLLLGAATQGESCFVGAPVVSGAVLASERGTAFIPVAMPLGAPPMVGVPSLDALYGQAGAASREEASDAAFGWSSVLFGPPEQSAVWPFWLYGDGRVAGSTDSRVNVTGAVAPHPSEMGGSAAILLERGAQLPAGHEGVAWVSLAALAGTPIERLAVLAMQRCRSFAERVAPSIFNSVTLGAMDPVRVAQDAGAAVAARATRVEWEDVPPRATDALVALRDALSSAIDGECNGLSMAERDDLAGWRSRIEPPPFADVPVEMRHLAREADDGRFASIPFPAEVQRVATDPLPPLPPPPDQTKVPDDACDWDDALEGWAYDLVLKYMLGMRRCLRFVAAHGTFEGAPMPGAVAFGVEGFRPWARRCVLEGHTIVRRDGRLCLLDCSSAPKTHINRTYVARMLEGSPDHALRDMMITHGAVFLADVEPQVVLQPPLRSLADGFVPVHVEMLKMVEAGWYQVVKADRLDEGKVDFACLPCRYTPPGAVPKWAVPGDNVTTEAGQASSGQAASGQASSEAAEGADPSPGAARVADAQSAAATVPAASQQAQASMPPACMETAEHGGDGGCTAVAPAPVAAKGVKEAAQTVTGAVQLNLLKRIIAGWRRIADNGAPRNPLYTLGGDAVESINNATGMRETRREREPGAGLRHTPAVRRPFVAKPGGGKPAGLVARREGSSSWCGGRYEYPPELKPLFIEVMLTVCILAHMSVLCDEPLFIACDDLKAWFHQFATAVLQRWACNIFTLDPEAVARGDVDAALASIFEQCLSMGTSPSSNIAQRMLTEATLSFEEDFNSTDLPVIDAMCASNARFAKMVEARKKLSARTGHCELALLKVLGFTDDCLLCIVGAARCVRGLVAWRRHMGPDGANFLMARVEKRQLGVSCTFIGGSLLVPGLLAYVSTEKRLRAARGLSSFLGGDLAVGEYRKLLGLLNHLVCVLAMPYYVMYGMYASLDAARDAGLGPGEVTPVVARARKAATQWLTAVRERAGNTMLAAAFDTKPTGVTVMQYAHSDAAVKGSAGADGEFKPGICGNLYAFIFILLLTPAWLELPIVALEFIGGILNGIVFDDLLADAPTTFVFDALVVPMVLAAKARSPLLQYLHDVFRSLPAVKRLGDNLFVAHEYGPSNILTDSGSRSKMKQLGDVMALMGMEPSWREVPPSGTAILDRAVEIWRGMSAEERDATIAAGGGVAGAGAANSASAGGVTEPPQGQNVSGSTGANDGSAGGVAGAAPAPPGATQNVHPGQNARGRRGAARRLGGGSTLLGAFIFMLRMSLGAAVQLAPAALALGAGCPAAMAGDGPPYVPPPVLPRCGAAGERTAPAAHATPTPLAPAPRGWSGRDGGAAPEPVAPTRVDPALLGRTQGAPLNASRPAPAVAPTPLAGVGVRVGGGYSTDIRCPASVHAAPTHAPAPRVAPQAHLGSTAAAEGVPLGQRVGPPIVRPLPGGGHAALAGQLTAALAADESPWALRNASAWGLTGLVSEVFAAAGDAFAPGTNKTDWYHWQKWEEVCARLGTTPWRTDVAANAGLDPIGHRRESLLKAVAMVVMYTEMQPRSHKDPAPDPRSAKNKILAVDRIHKAAGYPQVAQDFVGLVLRGLLRRYARKYGIASLARNRKRPLSNAQILGMLQTPEGASRGNLTVVWAAYEWVAARALFETLAETGMRKAEVTRSATDAEAARDFAEAGLDASLAYESHEVAQALARVLPATADDLAGTLFFANLVWKIGGCEVAAPTPEQLASLGPGDGVWLRHGTAKNDPIGEFFAATPSFLPFTSGAERCACRALAALERAAMVAPARRGTTPLFGPKVGEEFSGSRVDAMFRLLLVEGGGVTEAELANYSVHSFRAFLASALLAAKVSRPLIKRILRWRGDASLEVYAHLSDGEWASYIEASRRARVDAAVASHLVHDFSGLADLLRPQRPARAA